jgi:xanthine dehydrogenase accessory factor
MSISTRAVHERLDRLRTERVPFVHARVVLAERPTSAKPGDEAIVLADGTIVGFVGGQCAIATVRNQGLEVLASGRSALIRIAPTPEAAQPGKTVVHNPCQSGGTLEIFMEPVLPAPVIQILGSSPIAMALAALGSTMGYETYSFESPVGDSPAGAAPDLAIVDAVVAASHGDGEEAILEAAVRANVPYVGLVASRKRGTAVLETLDLDADQKARIHTPAGLDISARTPEEVAVSILAEIIATRTGPKEVLAASLIATATDPVCHMDVAMVPTSLHADIDGETWWFCCAGCQERFTADPQRFLEV